MLLGANALINGCTFPTWMPCTLVLYMISFIVLFGNFYAKAYLSKKQSSLTKTAKKSNNATHSSSIKNNKSQQKLHAN